MASLSECGYIHPRDWLPCISVTLCTWWMHLMRLPLRKLLMTSSKFGWLTHTRTQCLTHAHIRSQQTLAVNKPGCYTRNSRVTPTTRYDDVGCACESLAAKNLNYICLRCANTSNASLCSLSFSLWARWWRVQITCPRHQQQHVQHT